MHEASPRPSRPFVTLISSTLRGDGAEQVLFGTESNGQIAPGVLERAGAGTLFINELEDLPPQAQRALLGTMESGQFAASAATRRSCSRRGCMSSARPGIEDAATTSSAAICSRISTRSSCACRRCANTPRTCPTCCATTSTAWSTARAAVPQVQRRGAEPPAQLSVARQRARAQESRAAPAVAGRRRGNPPRGNRARTGARRRRPPSRW